MREKNLWSLEVKRREFIKVLIGGGLLITGVLSLMAEKCSLHKFPYALRIKKYPGKLRPLGNINKIGKWRG